MISGPAYMACSAGDWIGFASASQIALLVTGAASSFRVMIARTSVSMKLA